MKKVILVLCLLINVITIANDTDSDSISMTPEEQCVASGYIWEDGTCVPSDTNSDEDSTLDDISSSSSYDH